MKRILTFLTVVLLAAFCVFISGCASGDRIDEKPWNSPAGWERSTFGVPY